MHQIKSVFFVFGFGFFFHFELYKMSASFSTASLREICCWPPEKRKKKLGSNLWSYEASNQFAFKHWTSFRLVVVSAIAIVITMMTGISSRHGRNRELHLMNHPIMEGFRAVFLKNFLT